jgi:hypothetical protein
MVGLRTVGTCLDYFIQLQQLLLDIYCTARVIYWYWYSLMLLQISTLCSLALPFLARRISR